MDTYAMIWPDQTSPALPVTIMISDEDTSESPPDGEPLAAESVNVRPPLLKLGARQAQQLGSQISAALSRLEKAKHPVREAEPAPKPADDPGSAVGDRPAQRSAHLRLAPSQPLRWSRVRPGNG